MTDFEKEILEFIRWRKKYLTHPTRLDLFFIVCVVVMVVSISLGALGFHPFSVAN